MTKLAEAVKDQDRLKRLREETLPAIRLYRYPRQKRFIEFRLRPPGGDYWTGKTGQIFEVRVRKRARFYAKLVSCVFKTVGSLESQDALAAGINGTGPLKQLTDSLKRRWKESPYWEGEQTKLDILTFEKV